MQFSLPSVSLLCCRCTVVGFPFPRLPPQVATLRCYSWKVFAIAAHYAQAEVTVWLDSSIRVNNSTAFVTMVTRAKQRGIQQRCVYPRMTRNILHTLPAMFEAFGDSPCAHSNFRQVCIVNILSFYQQLFQLAFI